MIPLFKPFMPELPQLNNILMSGKLSSGEYTEALEKRLATYLGVEHVMVTNTFSNAISVAITTLGLSIGDEIIASPMGCLVSTQPYAASGLKIKWCDVDPTRGTLSPDALRKAVTPKTRAIVHNHYCGYVGYIDEINKIGAEYGIPVINDGIECFGSEYKTRKVGNCGTDVTVFAMSAVRIPNTIDGGILVFKDAEHYIKAKRIRDCGIDRSRFRDDIGEINPGCDISEIGYSATMSNVNAYIGLCQMEHAEKLLSKHKKNAEWWQERLKDCSYARPMSIDNTLPNYWIFGVLAEDKRAAIKRFRKEGFYASGVHINNNIYSVFGDYIDLPGVNDFYNHFVALPCGWWMEDKHE